MISICRVTLPGGFAVLASPKTESDFEHSIMRLTNPKKNLEKRQQQQQQQQQQQMGRLVSVLPSRCAPINTMLIRETAARALTATSRPTQLPETRANQRSREKPASRDHQASSGIVMTVLDAAASTAFASLHPTPSGGGGVLQQQRHQTGGRDPAHGSGARASAATRLGSIDPAPPAPPLDTERGLERRRLFSFGAIADVQYADQDDGWNFRGDYRRYYRGGLRQLTGAVDVWLRDETHRFVLQLGDVIDGSNKRQGQSEEALRSVKAEIDRLAASLPLGVLNSLGNHELYNFPKERWAKELDCSNRAKAAAAAAGAESSHGTEEEEQQEEECFYYSFCPDDSYRFIALDSYDVNAIREEPGPGDVSGGDGGDGNRVGEGEADGGAREGREVLETNNPNRNKNDGDGMKGLQKRFVQYNGGVSSKQLLWLEDQLAEASRAGQRVVGFGHVPIHPAEPSAHTLLWNYEDVLEVMHKFDCVALFLSGHRHRETYVRDEKGIHHISLAAALETPSDKEAFASVDVYADCLELRGHGMVESRTLALEPMSNVL